MPNHLIIQVRYITENKSRLLLTIKKQPYMNVEYHKFLIKELYGLNISQDMFTNAPSVEDDKIQILFKDPKEDSETIIHSIASIDNKFQKDLKNKSSEIVRDTNDRKVELFDLRSLFNDFSVKKDAPKSSNDYSHMDNLDDYDGDYGDYDEDEDDLEDEFDEYGIDSDFLNDSDIPGYLRNYSMCPNMNYRLLNQIFSQFYESNVRLHIAYEAGMGDEEMTFKDLQYTSKVLDNISSLMQKIKPYLRDCEDCENRDLHNFM